MTLFKTAILLASLFVLGLCQVPLLGTWSVYYPLNDTIPSEDECILIGDVTFAANPANDSTVLMTVYEWNGYCPADYISDNSLTYIIPFPSNFTFEYDFDLSDGEYPATSTDVMYLNSSVYAFFQYGYYNYNSSQTHYTKYAGLSYVVDGNFMIVMGAFKVVSDLLPLLGTWSVYYPLNDTIPSYDECILIGDVTFKANPANDSTVLMTVYEWNGYCPADYVSHNSLTYIIPFPSNFAFDYDFDLSDGEYPATSTDVMYLNSSVYAFFQYGYYNYNSSQKHYTKYAGLSYVIDGNFMIVMGAFKVVSDQVPLLGTWSVYYPLNDTIPSEDECILIGDVTFAANPANYSTVLMTVYEWNGYCPADYVSHRSLTYIIPFPSDFTFTYDFDLSDGEYPATSTDVMYLNSSVYSFFQYGYYNYNASQKHYTKYAGLSYVVDGNFMIVMGAFKLATHLTPLLGTWSVYFPLNDTIPSYDDCILIGDVTFAANPANYSTVLMTVYDWNGYCPADYVSDSSLTYIIPFPSDFTFDYDFDLSDKEYPATSTDVMYLNSSVYSFFQYGYYNYNASTPDIQNQYIGLNYVVDGNFMIVMGAMKVTDTSSLIES